MSELVGGELSVVRVTGSEPRLAAGLPVKKKKPPFIVSLLSRL
jgi:hypothetical protein